MADVDSAKSDMTKYYADKVSEASKNLTDAKTALADAKQAVTDKEKAQADAQDARDKARSAYDAAVNAEKTHSADLKAKTDAVDTATSNLTAFNEAVDAYDEAVTAYKNATAAKNTEKENCTRIYAGYKKAATDLANAAKKANNDTYGTAADAVIDFDGDDVTATDTVSTIKTKFTNLKAKVDALTALTASDTTLATETKAVTDYYDATKTTNIDNALKVLQKSADDFNTKWSAANTAKEKVKDVNGNTLAIDIEGLSTDEDNATPIATARKGYQNAVDEAQKALDDYVANFPSVEAAKKTLDEKETALTAAKEAVATAEKEQKTAETTYNNAVKANSEILEEQAIYNKLSDEEKALIKEHVGNTHELYDGLSYDLNSLAKLEETAEKAIQPIEKLRIAKTDAQEKADIASEKYTRAKAAYQASKNKLSKPVITVKAGKKCVKVSWKKVSGATKYKLRVKKGNGKYKSYYTKKTSFKIKAKKGTKVRVCVRAQKGSTVSKYSTKKAARAK